MFQGEQSYRYAAQQSSNYSLQPRLTVTKITKAETVDIVESRPMLVAIKVLHTVIWAVLAGCILALPLLAARREFRWGWIISAIILAECFVLGLNAGRCPLTDWAARYTSNRADNFDIYLPLWLAHFNKVIFGTLFLLGEGALLINWRRTRALR